MSIIRRPLYARMKLARFMKPKVTAVELARDAGVDAKLVRRYAKELRELVQEEDDECE